nr:MAG TPA_asm: hypothetical protein [Caudoviricetes sp.]
MWILLIASSSAPPHIPSCASSSTCSRRAVSVAAFSVFSSMPPTPFQSTVLIADHFGDVTTFTNLGSKATRKLVIMHQAVTPPFFPASPAPWSAACHRRYLPDAASAPRTDRLCFFSGSQLPAFPSPTFLSPRVIATFCCCDLYCEYTIPPFKCFVNTLPRNIFVSFVLTIHFACV